MKRFLQEKWKTKDIEFGVFLLFLLCMAVYYGWRLFALTPWYDELYTYYYFISRGPVYAAIHWPLPNNHVGYSVLSGFLDLFGNSAIGLRGISWMSSLVSICLLFTIGKKCFPKGFAMVPVFFFCAMGLVNQLAVQGRGYALSTCLYLTAFYELLQICQEKKKQNRHYFVFAIALVWALYTLPSSVYFVIPICAVGGIVLLLQKRNREFIKLFITAIISAISTIVLYAVIWLAIGSNLLSKTDGSSFFGQGHVAIILHAPFKALQTGIRYMLDTPYIQSVGREGYLPLFGNWIKNLLDYYYRRLSIPLMVIIILGVLTVVWKIVRCKESREKGMIEWFLLLSFVMTPLMLILQASLPYYRVFSYFGIPVALLVTWLFVQILEIIRKPGLAYSVTLFAGALCVTILVFPGSRAQYGDREAAIEDAFSYMSPEPEDSICVTDCDQEYLLKYMYDIETVQYEPEGADYVLLDKTFVEIARKSEQINSAEAWKYYLTPDEISMEEIEKAMEVCYENNRFVLYRKRK
ncbi:MAG: glycosyltransferase family 39 protein [Lachnospiraceae bacterium]|nr:glycosyltransferase family 39 protein [Lachnospiraceae bacterium]